MKENVQARANQLGFSNLNKHAIEENLLLPTNEYQDIIRKAIRDLSEEKEELRKLANQTMSTKEKQLLKKYIAYNKIEN